jgi:hypothetical protein
VVLVSDLLCSRPLAEDTAAEDCEAKTANTEEKETQKSVTALENELKVRCDAMGFADFA